MYSLVLMAALSTTNSTPDCFWRCGCCGVRVCGCYGGYGCGCYGCYGCYGGCYGVYGYSGYGCYGWGCYGGWGSWGCFGCYGGMSCYGGYGCYGPVQPAPTQKKTAPGEEPGPMPKKTELENKARLIVNLPADAKLFIDGQQMKSTAAQRSFLTPPLLRGRTYYYELRAEVVRDGQTLVQTQRVVLRPGEVIQASFNDMSRPATASVQSDQ